MAGIVSSNIVCITFPSEVKSEVDLINELFDSGLSKLHIRKPDWNSHQIRQFILGIKEKYRDRLALHQCHQLTEEMDIKHLHFKEIDRQGVNENLIVGLKDAGMTISTSAHFECLLPDLDIYDYVFFGPVFDSISKTGYQSSVSAKFRLAPSLSNVYAIGGVSSENINQVVEMNFKGAALLGTLWSEPSKAVENYLKVVEQCSQSVPSF